MARPRKDTTRKITPLKWARVFEMGVEVHTSKRTSKDMLRLDFQLHPEIKQYPVSDYFDPTAGNEFFRAKWLDFVQDMKDAGHDIRGRNRSIEIIVELSDDWLMPEALGYTEEEEEWDGKLRTKIEIRNSTGTASTSIR